MTVARLYMRVSTEEQAASGYSLGAQKERLEAFCIAQGWSIAGRYIDDGVSAKNLERPEFQRMMREAQAGDVVLVVKLDRLTRSVRDLDDLLRLFEKRDITFHSISEHFDTTTAAGRLFMRMIAEISQWEREVIAERTAEGKRKKATGGEWGGGPIPFGYVAVPSGKTKKSGKELVKLVPDEERGHLVDAIYRRYLEGYGVRAICLWLNNTLGVRTTNGERFQSTTVVRILRNPIYCGDIVHGRRTKGPVIRVPGEHESLVSREVFERVQGVFETRKRYAARQATGEYPFTGVSECGSCGGNISVYSYQKKGKRYHSYRCYRYAHSGGCGDHPLISFSGKDVERAFLAEFKQRFHPDHIGDFIAEFNAAQSDDNSVAQAEITRLEADLVDAESAVKRWDRGYETGKLEFDEYIARTQPHKERIKAIKAQINDQRAKVAKTLDFDALRIVALDIDEAWRELTNPERKSLLQQIRRLGARIVLHADRRVEIRLDH